jgi:hypothetical protein
MVSMKPLSTPHRTETKKSEANQAEGGGEERRPKPPPDKKKPRTEVLILEFMRPRRHRL